MRMLLCLFVVRLDAADEADLADVVHGFHHLIQRRPGALLLVTTAVLTLDVDWKLDRHDRRPSLDGVLAFESAERQTIDPLPGG